MPRKREVTSYLRLVPSSLVVAAGRGVKPVAGEVGVVLKAAEDVDDLDVALHASEGHGHGVGPLSLRRGRGVLQTQPRCSQHRKHTLMGVCVANRDGGGGY